MKVPKIVLTSAFLSLATPCSAIAPESGLYWQPSSPGRGAYLEVQGETALLFLYAFDAETGGARFFSASAQLRGDFQTLCAVIEPPFGASEGFYPIHGFRAPLFELTGGRPLGQAAYGGQESERQVGFAEVVFGFGGSVTLNTYLEDGQSEQCQFLSRFPFGQQAFFGAGGQAKLFFDLMGDWVFVDQADRSAPPMRFNFSERTPEALPSIVDENWWSPSYDYAIYRDPSRSAEFKCADVPQGASGSTTQPIKAAGCELFVEGQLILSAQLSDVGLDRIQGFRGPMPPRGEAPFRRAGTMIGLRVRDVE